MAFRAPLGDRRSSPRLEVSGHLWASIGMRHEAVLRDITANGALLEVRLSGGLPSIRAAVLGVPPSGPEVMVQVRHMSPVTDSRADDRQRFGVEFVRVASADRQAIRAFVQAATPRDIRSSRTD